MNTKKNVLLVGLIGTLLVLVLFFLETSFCYASPLCMEVRSFFSNDMFVLVFLTIPIFLLSLITYKMRDEVFRAWWGFARWWVLVIIAATLFLQNAGGGGGMGIGGAVSGAFDALVVGILYFILVIVSLVKIMRAYLKTK